MSLVEFLAHGFIFGKNFFDLSGQIFCADFQQRGRLIQKFGLMSGIFNRGTPRDSFNPANARSNSAFADDFKSADLPDVFDMRAAAKFTAEIFDADDAYNIAVFFAEESHCAEFLSLVNRHLFNINVDGL